MGKTGFVIVAAAALLATTSAINATLFSAFNYHRQNVRAAPVFCRIPGAKRYSGREQQ